MDGEAHIALGLARMVNAMLVLERYAKIDLPSTLPPGTIADDPGYMPFLRRLLDDPFSIEQLHLRGDVPDPSADPGGPEE